MVTNPEMLDSDLDNSELRDVINDLNSLKKDAESIESSITKAPEKWIDSKHPNRNIVVFDYKNDWEIVTEKVIDTKSKKEIYKVRIKKREKDGWHTQNFWESETFDFSAENKTSFNKKLWDALDQKIGTKRDRLPKTGGKVYDMLWKQSQTIWNIDEQENWSNHEQNNWNTENVETTTMPKGLRIENGVYVYRVQSGDTRSELIGKLSKYAPLSYLKNWYRWSWDGANSFNVWSYLPDHLFDAWVDLIVPNKESIKNVREFKKAQLTAIDNMKKNSKYWEKVKKLFESKKKWWYWYSEETVANALTAYARSESSRLARNENVWECALFRYEPTQVFSYWYHHVALSFKNWKSTKNLAWDKAFNSLNLKIWDTCDPVKSGMLCLAYMIEKNSGEYSKFFDIENNLQWCCDRYNWNGRESYNPNYDKKLKNNYNNIKNLK